MKQVESKAKVLALASIGGALEMYDFVIYIFFAPIFAKIFFPVEKPYLAMMSTLAIFATGYLFRPLGGFLFGHLGDRYGRRTNLLITIIIMGGSVILMALMPTYHQIGLFSPVAFCVLRILQGIALGGDLPGAMTFVAEYANDKYRGVFMGYLFLGVNLGMLLASFSAMLFINFLSADQLAIWGWRVAFLIGALLFVVGVYFRRQNIETPIFKKISEANQQLSMPILTLFKMDWFNVLRAFVMCGLFGVIIVQLFLYMPVYLKEVISLGPHSAMVYNTMNIVIFSALIPLVGMVSDAIGRKPVVMVSGLFFLFLSHPVYRMIDTGLLPNMLFAFLVFDIFAAGVVSTVPVIISELFKSTVRNSAIGISYNFGFAIFGGIAPLVSTYFIKVLHDPASLSINLMFLSLLMLLFLVPMRLKGKIDH